MIEFQYNTITVVILKIQRIFRMSIKYVILLFLLKSQTDYYTVTFLFVDTDRITPIPVPRYTKRLHLLFMSKYFYLIEVLA